MRAAVGAFLWALPLAGCATFISEPPTFSEMVGVWELVSLNGQPLPVEMGNGQVLVCVSALWTPLSKEIGCPPFGVNSTFI